MRGCRSLKAYEIPAVASAQAYDTSNSTSSLASTAQRTLPLFSLNCRLQFLKFMESTRDPFLVWIFYSRLVLALQMLCLLPSHTQDVPRKLIGDKDQTISLMKLSNEDAQPSLGSNEVIKCKNSRSRLDFQPDLSPDRIEPSSGPIGYHFRSRHWRSLASFETTLPNSIYQARSSLSRSFVGIRSPTRYPQEAATSVGL
jgi:hypothetical protein